ncbi:MAG TPA: hypothetical protein VHC19_27445 [Pirellulales bacterium]|jgi:hypothetical protein|nr:hypothetical protein [Pirellulales bacterium]
MDRTMKERVLKRIYWILLILSLLLMAGYQIWDAQRPSEEEVQQRMQEGLRSLQEMEKVRAINEKFEAEQNRAFSAQDGADR